MLQLEWTEFSNGQISSERPIGLEDEIRTGLNDKSFSLHSYKPLVFPGALKVSSLNFIHISCIKDKC